MSVKQSQIQKNKKHDIQMCIEEKMSIQLQ